MQLETMKVAIVHDWLVGYAGADRVVDQLHRIFPDAPIYTLVYDRGGDTWAGVAELIEVVQPFLKA